MQATRGRVSQTEADDSWPENSGTEDVPASAISISRKKPGRNSFPRGAQQRSSDGGDSGGGRGRKGSFLSPSPSPRLASMGGVRSGGGGSGNKCITTPVSATRMRGSSRRSTTPLVRDQVHYIVRATRAGSTGDLTNLCEGKRDGLCFVRRF